MRVIGIIPARYESTRFPGKPLVDILGTSMIQRVYNQCKKCNQQLSYTFEVDHRISLENGGSNHVTNLDALCVGCHKEKTLEKNLF